MAHVTLKGGKAELLGTFPKIGEKAKEFILSDVSLTTKKLHDFKGALKVLAILPSVDTGVCAKESVTLNSLAKAYPAVKFLVISKDLPFAQQRFCKDQSLSNIITLSDCRSGSLFAEDYGVKIISGPLDGMLARAIIVLDKEDRISSSLLFDEISADPDLSVIERELKILTNS